MRKKIGAYRVLAGKHKGKRQLGKPRRKWEDNIKMDLQELGWGMDWIGIRTLAGSCECGNELAVSIKCGIFLD
jgi:hypothetical protein